MGASAGKWGSELNRPAGQSQDQGQAPGHHGPAELDTIFMFQIQGGREVVRQTIIYS